MIGRPPELVGCQAQSLSRSAGANQVIRERREPADAFLRKPPVAPRGRLIRFEPPLAACPDDRVLADCKHPRRSAGADQLGPSTERRRRSARKNLDIRDTKAVVASGRG
jgi:hypothetical protein